MDGRLASCALGLCRSRNLVLMHFQRPVLIGANHQTLALLTEVHPGALMSDHRKITGLVVDCVLEFFKFMTEAQAMFDGLHRQVAPKPLADGGTPDPPGSPHDVS